MIQEDEQQMARENHNVPSSGDTHQLVSYKRRFNTVGMFFLSRWEEEERDILPQVWAISVSKGQRDKLELWTNSELTLNNLILLNIQFLSL